MSEILLNDEFVAIPLNVGKALGDFDEAVFLQFIYRWCLNAEKNSRDHNFKEGHYWTYMTYDEIHKQLPMFSVSKIKRIIKSVKEKGVLKVGSFNKVGYDRTNWYRVDVDILNELVYHKSEMNRPLVQIDPIEKFKMNRPIPKSSSKDLKDTALPEKPTGMKLSPPQEKEKRYTALRDGGIVSKIYAKAYEQVFEEEHKKVEENELNRLEELIELFIEEHDIDYIDFEEMLIYYFKNLTNKNNGTIHYLAKDNHGYVPLLKRLLDDYTDAYLTP